MATTGDVEQVRLTAVQQLGDQEVLAEVARGDRSWNVRKTAVSRLKDDDLLAEFAKGDQSEHVRAAAVEKLKNQAVLAEVVKADESLQVRVAAAEKLEDQALLADVATRSGDWRVHEAAAKKLNDEGLALLGERYSGLAKDPLGFMKKTDRILRLVVVDDLPGNAGERLRLVLTGMMKQLFADMLTAAPVDAVLQVRVRGKALASRYGSGLAGGGSKRYAGAQVSVRLCVLLGQRSLLCRTFRGTQQPLGQIPEDSYQTPDSAPFERALVPVARSLLAFAEELRGFDLPAMRSAMAFRGPLGEVAEERLVTAIKKLTDQAALAELANDPDPAVSRTASARLKELRK